MGKVEPIRKMADVYRIEDTLFKLGTPRGDRMFLLFEVGIFLGLRIGDMLKLRVGDIRGKDTYTFVPEKTDERRHKDGTPYKNYRPKKLTITIPAELRKVVGEMCRDRSDDELLFPSTHQRKSGRPMSRQTARRMMAEIGKLAGLDYRVGCHTLRKTFGYQIYRQHHDVAWLQTWFQHSSPSVTLIYIGIADDEKKAVTDRMPFQDRGRFDWSIKRR